MLGKRNIYIWKYFIYFMFLVLRLDFSFGRWNILPVGHICWGKETYIFRNVLDTLCFLFGGLTFPLDDAIYARMAKYVGEKKHICLEILHVHYVLCFEV